MTAAFPDGGVAVLLLALFVKPVNLGDLAGFVVATNQGDAVGIADFEAEEEGEGFETKVTTVNEVAEEDVVLVAGDAGVAFFVYAETGAVVPTGHFAATLLLFFIDVFVTEDIAGIAIIMVLG